MKRNFLLFIVLLFNAISISAQNFQWVDTINVLNGTSNLTIAKYQNFYNFGSFRITHDFDYSANSFVMNPLSGGTANNYTSSTYIAKYGYNNTFKWAKQIQMVGNQSQSYTTIGSDLKQDFLRS